MTNDAYAREIIRAGRDLGITPRGIVIAFATVYVESNWIMWANAKVHESLTIPHERVGSDGKSVGLFQQQVVWGNGAWWWGSAADCMDPYKSAVLFFTRLAKLDYNGPNSPGSYAQAIQRSAFPDRYDQRMREAQAYYDQLAGDPVSDNRPDFNEFPIWSPSTSSRNGIKPTMFLIHTQEGGGGNAAAEDLANYLANPANQVSYHYTISQASDGGVTVVDCADTDEASWSVGNANSISINLCFAGSRASWTRDQWLKQAKAIDVAAYLAVQDAKKYGFSTLVVAPPYSSGRPGISDHRWVTDVFKWGTHTDVGSGFPWDVFAASVAKYTGESSEPEPPAEKRFPDDWSDREIGIESLRQQRGPSLEGWPQLDGMTVVDYLAALGAKVDRLLGGAQ